ncbi:MAG TPA: glycosyltransferase family 4 protein [Deltaproteobacteria bacterium]|nr:glycosyltransferase family 4 protein [Deltaproteobacteria bacterium]
MRIALLIPTLNGGGAERVMSAMANYWAAQDHQVHLFTHDSAQKDFYPLHEGIVRHGWDISKPPRHLLDTIKHNIQRITLARKGMFALHPDIAISFTVRMNIQNLLALSGTNIPLIVSERNNPLKQSQPLPWEFLRKFLYPRASAVVVQTEPARKWATGFVPDHRVYTVANPLSCEENSLGEIPSALKGKSIICSMGRLVPSKGFDLLMRSFHIASRDKPDWILLILGEGEDRGRLEKIAKELGISDRIFMPGRVKNTHDYLESSKIFVLSSKHEGFPNALIEAMSLGMPVISTDCPFGPSEIIHDGIDGMLIPNKNIHELALALKHLMDNEAERIRFGEKARETSRRFNIEVIMDQWEKLISHVIKK